MATLMAVFAHPDDETFICGGSLAKYAAQGHRVVLVCATKGEMGRRMGVPPIATRETIAKLREDELSRACRELHVAQLEWLNLRDKTLEIQSFDTLTDSVLRHIELEQPQVVVTFHEKLGGHPDHCTIGGAAAAATLRYREKSGRDVRLFFVAWPGMARDPQTYGLSPEQFVEVDVSAHLAEKLRAYRAHKTQSQLNAWLWKSDAVSMQRLASTEYFIQADKPIQKRKSLLE